MLPEDLPTTGVVEERTFTYSYDTEDVIQVRLRRYVQFPEYVAMDFLHFDNEIVIPPQIEAHMYANYEYTAPLESRVLWFPFNAYFRIYCCGEVIASGVPGTTTLMEIQDHQAVIDVHYPMLFIQSEK